MSAVVQAVPDYEGEDGETLPISFPKKLESYKVASPEFRTPIDMAPRKRVRVVGEGLIAKMAGDFGASDGDSVRWTVVLDSASLEEIE